MTLRARPLEREILRRHKAARRQSPAVRQEDRRRGRRTADLLINPVIQALWPLLPLTALWHSGRAEIAFAAAAIYALATSLIRAHELATDLRQGADVAVLGSLPASDSLLFDRAWKRLAWQSLSTAGPFACLAAAALPGKTTEPWRLAAAVAIVASGVGVVLACTVPAAFLRAEWTAKAGALLHVALIGAFFAKDYLPAELPPSMRGAILVLPGSWIMQAFQDAVGRGNPSGLVWLAPALALIATLPFTLGRLRERYRIAEILMPPTGFADARFEFEEDADAGSDEPAAPATIVDVRTALMPPTPVSAGPIERAVLHVLRRRESEVCDFLLGADPGWTSAWKTGAVMSIVGLALAALPWPGLSLLLAALGALTAIPALGGSWPGLGLVRVGTRFSPLYAPYPIGYGETCRTILKANAVRFAAALPIAIAAGLAVAAPRPLSMQQGAEWGVRALLLALVLQPAMLVFKFSRGTSDLIGFKAKALAIAGVVCGFVLVAFGAVMAFTEGSAGAAMGLALIATPSAALLLVYGVFYGRPIFDLVCERSDLPPE